MRVPFFFILITFSLLQVAGAEYRKVIDTFSTCIDDKGYIPCGWYSTQKEVRMFSIQNEDGNRYVKIQTAGGNTTIGMRYCYNAKEYPVLNWKWRVLNLPANANESIRKLSDSGAGVYVIFRGPFKLNRMIKYVWSTTLQKGVVTESPFNSLVKIVVLQSGMNQNQSGKWLMEKVNVYEDFQRLFGAEPPMIEAVAIMSDSDNTNSAVEADYDDFWISTAK